MAGKKARKLVKKAAKAERKREKKAAKAAKLGLHRPAALLADTLGAMKVPPALRGSGSALAEFATSDFGRAVLVAALTGAAEAILRHRPEEAQAGAQSNSVTAKDVVQSAALAAAGVVKDAAKTVLPPALVGETGAAKKGRAGEHRPASDGTSHGGG